MSKPILHFLSDGSGYRVGMIAQGLIRACNDHNLSLLWRNYEQFSLKSLGQQSAGIVIWAQKKPVQRIWAKAGKTLPLVSTNGSTFDLAIPAVIPDSVAIAETVADHLVGEGLTNFIFVGWKKNPSARWRAESFRAAFEKRLSRFRFRFFDVEFENKFWGSDSGRGRSLIRLLRQSPLPLAVIGMNDQTAVSCIECVKLAGLRIPHPVAVVGVDDHPLYANMYIPLTSIHIDYAAIGQSAVEMILARQGAGRDHTSAWERRHLSGDLVVRDSSQLRLEGDPQVSRALRFIHSNYKKPITLTILSDIAGLSRSSISARFNNVVGESPIRYLVDYRLKRACRLLKTTSLTVSEVAFEVGFEDQAYFGRAFKRYAGKTPSEYRQGGI